MCISVFVFVAFFLNKVIINKSPHLNILNIKILLVFMISK